MAIHCALTELYRGENPLVDIVAVHGLMGDAFKTWTTKKTGKCWLSDPQMLPKHLKDSRILTFSYNADVAAFCGKTSSDRIMHHAHTLVAELSANRQLEDAVERPIIFICHSLGGIIVKRALAYANSRMSRNVQDYHLIYISTYGLLFLGTPHNGSSKAAMASTAQRIISTVMPSKILDTDKQLLKGLEEGSETLQNVTDMFIPLMARFRVYFFWEQLKTDMGIRQDYIVDEKSAAPLMYDTERSGLPYDHRGMTKFESASSPGYSIIVAALKRYSNDGIEVVPKRHKQAQSALRISRQNEAAELLESVA